MNRQEAGGEHQPGVRAHYHLHLLPNEPVHIIRVLEDSLDVAEIKERLEWKSPNAFGGAAAIEVSDVAGFAMCGKCGSTASAGAGDIRDCKDIQTPLTGDSRRFQRACQHGTRNQGESRTSGRSRRRAVPPSRAGKAPTEQSSGR